MQVIVERMTVEDLEAVIEIEEQSFPVPWSRNSFLHELFENERAIYLVAKDYSGKVVGYIGVWIIFDEGHITNLATHPQYRRFGIGEKLIEHLTRICKERGVKHLTLEVRRSNIPAQGLYQKVGFVHMGIRRKYYLDNNEDAIIMWKGPI